MSDGAMQEIESYLRRLRAALRSLSPEEAEDIVKEIGSHLRESAGTPEGAAENVAAVLERLGSPTDLASRFTTYSMARKAERSGSPWLALRTIFRWAALSVRGVGALVISLAGYGLALSFLLAGLAKPFNRDRVGLWKLSDPALGPLRSRLPRWCATAVGFVARQFRPHKFPE